jgi:hypothetical protein
MYKRNSKLILTIFSVTESFVVRFYGRLALSVAECIWWLIFKSRIKVPISPVTCLEGWTNYRYIAAYIRQCCVVLTKPCSIILCSTYSVFPYGGLHHRVQNGSGAHPASYPMVTRGSFLGLKRPGREADHSLPSSAEVKNAWSYTSTPPIRRHSLVLS